MRLLAVLLLTVLVYSTTAQTQLEQCRAELENVHNEATAQIKNLTDSISEFVNDNAQNASLSQALKEKMRATAADIKVKWNEFGDTMQRTFENLGGKITNAWQNVFGNQNSNVMVTLPPGVTVPAAGTIDPSITTNGPSFWDRIRGVFG